MKLSYPVLPYKGAESTCSIVVGTGMKITSFGSIVQNWSMSVALHFSGISGSDPGLNPA